MSGLTRRVQPELDGEHGGGGAGGGGGVLLKGLRLGDKTPTIISILEPKSGCFCVCVCVSHGTPAG